MSELLNLFADEENLPNVIVGPSTYAVTHKSISKLKKNKELIVEIISPGIDTIRFHGERKPIGFSRSHPGCRELREKCVIIGFMARIAIEKNPGLFVLAAHEVYKVSSNTRFVMIGDGKLLPDIKKLVHYLGMTEAFYFPGWIMGNALPDMLSDIDIIINPSLRAWSETFCIANLEAMAMKIPLVTFAVGGVGEYVSPPPSYKRLTMSCPCIEESVDSDCRCMSDISPSTIPDYEIVDNAVIVNNASPVAIAEAVLQLVNNKSLAQNIGMKARESVLTGFHSERQTNQYYALYRNIYDNFRRLRR